MPAAGSQRGRFLRHFSLQTFAEEQNAVLPKDAPHSYQEQNLSRPLQENHPSDEEKNVPEVPALRLTPCLA